jgi:hypothetical protein
MIEFVYEIANLGGFNSGFGLVINLFNQIINGLLGAMRFVTGH